MIFTVLQAGTSQLSLFFFLFLLFSLRQAAGMFLHHETRQIKGNFVKRGCASNVATDAVRFSK